MRFNAFRKKIKMKFIYMDYMIISLLKLLVVISCSRRKYRRITMEIKLKSRHKLNFVCALNLILTMNIKSFGMVFHNN